MIKKYGIDLEDADYEVYEAGKQLIDDQLKQHDKEVTTKDSKKCRKSLRKMAFIGTADGNLDIHGTRIETKPLEVIRTYR